MNTATVSFSIVSFIKIVLNFNVFMHIVGHGPKPPTTGQKVCMLPREIGPCRGAHTRWYFNPGTNRCERFSFGGCSGNANNFRSERECQRQCGMNNYYKSFRE